MTLADLIFTAAFLSSVLCLMVAGIAMTAGNRRLAATVLAAWMAGAAMYVLVTMTVKAHLTTTIVELQNAGCSDDWCLAVDHVERVPDADLVRYMVTLQLSSRALARPQRENGVDVQLLARGKHYDAMPDPKAVPLDLLLNPGQIVTAKRFFLIPAVAQDPALVVIHRGFIRLSWLIPGREPFEKTLFRLH